jgi:transmembrane 9 superfamily protein 2/4
VTAGKIQSQKVGLKYPFSSLPFCPSFDYVWQMMNNKTLKFSGDDRETTPFQFNMNHNMTYVPMCDFNYTSEDYEDIEWYINKNFQYNLYVDGLSTITYAGSYGGETQYTYSIPLGYWDSYYAEYVLYNHWDFQVELQPDMDNDNYYRIVGFKVAPVSCEFTDDEDFICHEKADDLILNSSGGMVTYSFDVEFVISEMEWANRWDQYMLVGKDKINWFNIGVSLIVVFLIGLSICQIVCRAVNRDIAQYELVRMNKKKKLQSLSEKSKQNSSKVYS